MNMLKLFNVSITLMVVIFLFNNFSFATPVNTKITQPGQKRIITKPTLVAPQTKPVRVDGIKAVVRGSGIDLILESELKRPKLDGTPNTLDSSITNALFKQKADDYHISQNPEENQKQYEMIAQNNNKTVKELDEMVMQAGFTPQEARKEFGQINAVNSLISYKVTGNMVVPESEVKAYYEENLEYESAAYHIQMVIVPFSTSLTQEEQLEQLQTLANAQDPNGVLNWDEGFWVNEEDLAVDKKFIAQLAQSQISLPKQMFNGFQLFKLVAKRARRLKSLDERYGQIVNLLRQPKYTELMTKFQQDLKDNASIIIFDHV